MLNKLDKQLTENYNEEVCDERIRVKTELERLPDQIWCKMDRRR